MLLIHISLHSGMEVINQAWRKIRGVLSGLVPNQEVLDSYELCFGEVLEKHRVVLIPRETSKLVRFSF